MIIRYLLWEKSKINIEKKLIFFDSCLKKNLEREPHLMLTKPGMLKQIAKNSHTMKELQGLVLGGLTTNVLLLFIDWMRYFYYRRCAQLERRWFHTLEWRWGLEEESSVRWRRRDWDCGGSVYNDQSLAGPAGCWVLGAGFGAGLCAEVKLTLNLSAEKQKKKGKFFYLLNKKKSF